MELLKAVRYIFVFIQSVLAFQFILDSINEWKESPIVSSVTIEDVNQEQLPAISLCIPTTLKWPGVIKAMSQIYPQFKQYQYWDPSLLIKMPWHWSWKNTIWRYLDKAIGFNSNQIEKLFPVNDHRKDFAKWFLNVVFNMKDDPTKVREFVVGPFAEAIGMAMIYTDLEVLHPTNIEMTKDFICNNQSLSYCEGITKESIESTYQNCASTPFCSVSKKDNYFISFDYNYNSYMGTVGHFKSYLTIAWLYDKYWTSEKILEYYIHNWYNEPEYSSIRCIHNCTYNTTEALYIDEYISKYLLVALDQLSTIKEEIFPLYLWHILNGIPLPDNDKISSFVLGYIEAYEAFPEVDAVMLIGGEMNLNAINCLRGMDLNSQACQSVNDFIKQFDQSKIKQFEEWMDEPKVHGDENEHYVLVPMCSFGNDALTNCTNAFRPSNLKAQDKKCFTYEEQRQVNVGPSNGFNFLLNLENLPHDKKEPLYADMYLHESGTYPDLFNVKTFPITILPGEEAIKVEISLTNRKSTENFEAISNEKKKCTDSKLSENQRKYSRVNCVMDTINNQAAEKCGCVPRNMDEPSMPICDFQGSICFRDATQMFKDHSNHTMCLMECNGRYYTADKTVEDLKDVSSYGQQYQDFLFRNPIGDLIRNTTLKETTWTVSDFEHIGKRYPLVHVYFKNPLKTVITQDAKITMAGMVSNIGGTLGIFLGVSMITLFDDFSQIFKHVRDFFISMKNRLFH